jgi:hypothetical protein
MYVLKAQYAVTVIQDGIMRRQDTEVISGMFVLKRAIDTALREYGARFILIRRLEDGELFRTGEGDKQEMFAAITSAKPSHRRKA